MSNGIWVKKEDIPEPMYKLKPGVFAWKYFASSVTLTREDLMVTPKQAFDAYLQTKRERCEMAVNSLLGKDKE